MRLGAWGNGTEGFRTSGSTALAETGGAEGADTSGVLFGVAFLGAPFKWRWKAR